MVTAHETSPTEMPVWRTPRASRMGGRLGTALFLALAVVSLGAGFTTSLAEGGILMLALVPLLLGFSAYCHIAGTRPAIVATPVGLQVSSLASRREVPYEQITRVWAGTDGITLQYGPRGLIASTGVAPETTLQAARRKPSRARRLAQEIAVHVASQQGRTASDLLPTAGEDAHERRGARWVIGVTLALVIFAVALTAGHD